MKCAPSTSSSYCCCGWCGRASGCATPTKLPQPAAVGTRSSIISSPNQQRSDSLAAAQHSQLAQQHKSGKRKSVNTATNLLHSRICSCNSVDSAAFAHKSDHSAVLLRQSRTTNAAAAAFNVAAKISTTVFNTTVYNSATKLAVENDTATPILPLAANKAATKFAAAAKTPTSKLAATKDTSAANLGVSTGIIAATFAETSADKSLETSAANKSAVEALNLPCEIGKYRTGFVPASFHHSRSTYSKRRRKSTAETQPFFDSCAYALICTIILARLLYKFVAKLRFLSFIFRCNLLIRIILFSLITVVTVADNIGSEYGSRELAGGCQRLQLCCPGRNHTCKSTIYDYYRHTPPPQYYAGGYGSSASAAAAYASSAAYDSGGDETFAAAHRSRVRRMVPQRENLVKLFEFSAGEKFPPVLTRRKRERVGTLILPDMVALDAVGERYARKFGQKANLHAIDLAKGEDHSAQRRRRKRSFEEHFVFGDEVEDTPTPERTIFQRGRPIIRYSVLNKYISLRVGKVRNEDAAHVNDFVDMDDRMRVMYVTEAEAECFCDAECLTYADCCFDYAQFCRPDIPEPCLYSPWSGWSRCALDKSVGGAPDQFCGGAGLQRRERAILRGAQNALCTPKSALVENRACFASCERTAPHSPSSTRAPQHQYHPHAHRPHSSHSLKDITTVALLLDYGYNESRMVYSRDRYYRRPHYEYPLESQQKYHYQHHHPDSNFRHHSYPQPQQHYQYHSQNNKMRSNSSSTYFQLLPTEDTRFDAKNNVFYCVRYELGWVNRNCVERRYKTKLFRQNVLCVECQPHAQLHRNTPRCASDLEDGEKGLWKLIGPLSCNGIWHRISRTDNCTCALDFPTLTPFLMV